MYLDEFITIAVAHCIALLSPGADFIYLVNTSISKGTKAGIAASLGIALSNGFYILFCLLGYATIFSQSDFFMAIIRILGGGYLFYLGATIFKSNRGPFENARSIQGQSTMRAEIVKSFFVSFLNPKISIFYISLCALAISKETPLPIQLLYGLWMFSIVFFWDSTLAFVLNKRGLKEKILSFSCYRKLTGLFLFSMGIGLYYPFIRHL